MSKWVWVLDLNQLDRVYPAIVTKATCEKCGKETIHPSSHQFKDDLPLNFITEDAVIYIPKVEWESRSRLSYWTGGDFFTRKRDLIVFTVPKHMGDEVIAPPQSAVFHDFGHTVIATHRPLDRTEYYNTVETTCFECIRNELGNPNHMQGNLRIWYVHNTEFIHPDEHGLEGLWFRKCEIGEYYKDVARMFNHTIRARDIYIRDNTKVAFYSPDEIVIEAKDHATLHLPSGAYIGYHPRPRRGLD
jgi:hypothetical protein